MTSQGYEDGREQSPKQQPTRIQTNQHGRKRKSREHRMGEGVGDQRQTPQDYVSAKKSVGETNQNAGKEGSPHELVLKWFGNPVH
jgi:hypothetical protein